LKSEETQEKQKIRKEKLDSKYFTKTRKQKKGEMEKEKKETRKLVW
jgi:hypothetical protein